MLKPLFGIALIMTCLAGCDRSPSASTTNITPVALHFKVDGMTCDGCAKSIESEVADLPGVTSCQASHESGSLTVQTTDPSIKPKIIAAVAELQFRIESVPTTNGEVSTPSTSANSSDESAQPATTG